MTELVLYFICAVAFFLVGLTTGILFQEYLAKGDLVPNKRAAVNQLRRALHYIRMFSRRGIEMQRSAAHDLYLVERNIEDAIGFLGASPMFPSDRDPAELAREITICTLRDDIA